jgi:hypothetical protein
MKKTILTIGLVIALGAALASPPGAFGQASADEKLFQDAKLLIFDKKWDAALAKLQQLTDAYAKSPYYSQAVFYKGECLSSIKGRERDALKGYEEYLELGDVNPSLAEEAEGSIIDLAYALYEKGERGFLREIEARLDHRDKVVRYYAAYKLSLIPDRAAASKAVPVLELRVSPESLQGVEKRRRAGDEPRMLHIRVTKRGQREPVLSLNIPWSLADLALSAMDEEDKAALRAKGRDINRILDDLAKSKEKLFRIEGDDGSIIEIWIE